jgi:hypothetical protein
MKTILLTIMSCLLLSSCKLPVIAFRQSDLDLPYIKYITTVAGGYRGHPVSDTLNNVVGPEDTAYNHLRIFVCTLQVTTTVRNSLVEETITHAGHPSVGDIEPMNGGDFRLYVAVMGNRAGDPAVYMPAIFDASGQCMRLGPAWIGSWNAGEFSFYKTLQHRADRKGGAGRWIYDRRENEDRRTGSIVLYGTGGALRKQSVRMVTDRKEHIASLDSFRVIRIFRRSPSQIGADKGVFFDVPEIFQDSSALRFHISSSK